MGSPEPRGAMAWAVVNLDQSGPKRRTSWPSSRASEVDAGDLRREPQPSDLEQPLHGRRRRTEAVQQLGRARRRARVGGYATKPPVELQLLRLLGHVVVGQEGVDGQVDDGRRPGDDARAVPRARPSPPRPPRPASACRGRSRRPTCGRAARAPRMLPAPRISRSDSAIWKPAPSSEALKMAWSRFRAMSRQLPAAAVQQVGVGAPARAADPARGAGRAGPGRGRRRGR